MKSQEEIELIVKGIDLLLKESILLNSNNEVLLIDTIKIKKILEWVLNKESDQSTTAMLRIFRIAGDLLSILKEVENAHNN